MNVNWIGPTLMQVGTEEQKQRYLRPMAQGKAIWCQGFSEPSAGSDLFALRTSAERDGDTFVIKAGPKFTLLGKNSLNEMCMATPAIAEGSLIVRTLSKSPTHPLPDAAQPHAVLLSKRRAHCAPAEGPALLHAGAPLRSEGGRPLRQGVVVSGHARRCRRTGQGVSRAATDASSLGGRAPRCARA